MPAAPYGGGQSAAKHLVQANIMLCGIGLPLPPITGDLNGIRIGTQEVTRLGMGDEAMREIAELIARVLTGKEPPENVKRDAVAFRRFYQRLHFVR